MSRRETVADRVEAIRKSIPPAEGRRSRLGHISKDDFAELIGAGRTRVIAWTTGKGYPEQRFRVKLAELSGGRWQPDDFARDAPPADRLTALEDDVANLTAALEAAGLAHDEVLRRLEALEDAARSRARPADASTGPRRRQR